MVARYRISCFALASVVAFGAACRGAHETHSVSVPADALVEDGVVYTPVARGPQGCVLYNFEIPGGYAPAALVYRSVEGEFSYDRPDRCVQSPETRP